MRRAPGAGIEVACVQCFAPFIKTCNRQRFCLPCGKKNLKERRRLAQFRYRDRLKIRELEERIRLEDPSEEEQRQAASFEF